MTIAHFGNEHFNTYICVCVCMCVCVCECVCMYIYTHTSIYANYIQ